MFPSRTPWHGLTHRHWPQHAVPVGIARVDIKQCGHRQGGGGGWGGVSARSHASPSDIEQARDPLECDSRLRGVSGVSASCQASFDMRLPVGNRRDCTRHVGPSIAGFGTEAATNVKYAATRLAWASATVEGPGHEETGSSIYF